jgi:hypothetical protein
LSYSHSISIVLTLKKRNFSEILRFVIFWCRLDKRHQTITKLKIALILWCFTKHINKQSCTVKQISVCYIHTVTVAVLYCSVTVNCINIFCYNFAPVGRKVTWPAVWPTVLLSQFCTTTVTAHRHCIIRCTADRVTTSWLMVS